MEKFQPYLISVDATHFFSSSEVNIFSGLFILLCLSLDGPNGFPANESKV